MATKTGVPLKHTAKGWEAECGCVFHIFDGLPSVEKEVKGSDETIMIGTVAPHWHPCNEHDYAKRPTTKKVLDQALNEGTGVYKP